MLLIALIGCTGEQPSPFVKVSQSKIDFQALAPIPDQLGLAGPIVGVHEDRLLVAGGANFAEPTDPELWEKPKLYHDRLFSLVAEKNSPGGYRWQTETNVRLPLPMGYSSVVSTPYGVLSIGGENSDGPLDKVFLIRRSSGAEQGGSQ